MPQKINLQIPEPCHESWQLMTPSEKGRHCSNCNKVVVDFTYMSDQQIADYFKQTVGQKTCGRFYNTQLNRDIKPTPTQRVFKPVKYLATSLLAIELFSHTAKANNHIDFMDTTNIDTYLSTPSDCAPTLPELEDSCLTDNDSTTTVDSTVKVCIDTCSESEYILIGDIIEQEPKAVSIERLELSGNVIPTMGICSPAEPTEHDTIWITRYRYWFNHKTISLFNIIFPQKQYNGSERIAATPANQKQKNPIKQKAQKLLAVLTKRIKILSSKV